MINKTVGVELDGVIECMSCIVDLEEDDKECKRCDYSEACKLAMEENMEQNSTKSLKRK